MRKLTFLGELSILLSIRRLFILLDVLGVLQSLTNSYNSAFRKKSYLFTIDSVVTIVSKNLYEQCTVGHWDIRD